MFEMKNEMDETAAKNKNEDFFKELDRDRREKGCEYAVLVSLPEININAFKEGFVRNYRIASDKLKLLLTRLIKQFRICKKQGKHFFHLKINFGWLIIRQKI